MKVTELHGDPEHSRYDSDGNIVCAIARIMLNDGPGWRDLIGTEE